MASSFLQAAAAEAAAAAAAVCSGGQPVPWFRVAFMIHEWYLVLNTEFSRCTVVKSITPLTLAVAGNCPPGYCLVPLAFPEPRSIKVSLTVS
jgi:hypothetical protein